MFRLLSICLILSMGLTCSAQMERGNFLISGNSDLHRNKYLSNTNTVFLLKHELGYMLTNRLLLGVGVQLATPYEGGNGINSLVRYYLFNRGDKGCFLDNRLSWVGQQFIVEVNLGYARALNPFIVWETSAYYQRQTMNPFEFNNTQVGLQTQLQLFLNRNWSTQHNGWTNILHRGTWMVGGTTANISYSRNFITSLDVQLRPHVGMMWTDRLLLGVQSNIELSHLFSADAYVGAVGIVPFARHYFRRFSNQTIGFLEGGYGFFSRFVAYDDSLSDEIDTTYFGAIGFNSFISPQVAFELKGGYEKLGRDGERWLLEMGFQLFLESRK